MLNILWNTHLLKNTCAVNRIFNLLHRIPLVKDVVWGMQYKNSVFKKIISVLAVIWEIIKYVFLKGLYMAVILIAAGICWGVEGYKNNGDMVFVYLQVFMFFTLIGAILNNDLFDFSEEGNCAISLFKIDEKKYTLLNYGYYLLTHSLYTLLFAFVLGLLIGVSPIDMFLMAAFVGGTKLFFRGLQMKSWKRGRKVDGGCIFGKVGIALAIVFLVAAGVSLKVKFLLPLWGLRVIYGIFITLGVWGFLVLIRFDDYKILYIKAKFATDIKAEKAKESIEKQNSRNALKMENGVTTTKEGLEGLNDIFFKRHKSLLWKSSRLISLLVILVTVIYCIFIIALRIKGAFQEFSDGEITRAVPILLFLLYFVNSGENFTQALFINCDHSLLTYPFYKKPGMILRLFKLRLVELIKVNSLTGVVIGICLNIAIFVAGGQNSLVSHFVLFVSPIAISVFFSVHYMAIYYLLQPYNSESDIKNPVYSIVKVVTYGVCYFVMDSGISGLTFAFGIIAFCVIYCVLAFGLVYMLAPKTFRIHA